eukprot:TRINITY_DN12539_c0_g1_i1.p2 TRINITY_DN12539_c0_g1~~TRINITY_DN12539_c0_g1_i1.p2  ORF type:complete len:230 (+),score=-27.61 TRINITY_DN12539_c0_g1_i1:522-1211(+)
MGNRLVEQRQGVTHTAVGRAGQQSQRRRLEGDGFSLKDVGKMAGDGLGRHLLQIELQTAGKNRHRNFLGIGGRQDEFDVLGWLFQGLQHGVEGRIGQHVHFVDHVDLEAAPGRRIHRILEQLAHLIDPGIGGRIDLEKIYKTTRIDFLAGRTLPARSRRDAGFTIEGFGQDAGQGGLADTTGAGEEIRVVEPLLGEGMGQRTDHMLLADQGGKASRAPFARQNLIAHAE